jgi:hypothetical protein
MGDPASLARRAAPSGKSYQAVSSVVESLPFKQFPAETLRNVLKRHEPSKPFSSWL